AVAADVPVIGGVAFHQEVLAEGPQRRVRRPVVEDTLAVVAGADDREPVAVAIVGHARDGLKRLAARHLAAVAAGGPAGPEAGPLLFDAERLRRHAGADAGLAGVAAAGALAAARTGLYPLTPPLSHRGERGEQGISRGRFRLLCLALPLPHVGERVGGRGRFL